MSDSNLDNLINKMAYSTPLRDRADLDDKIPIKKQVLISHHSINQSKLEYEQDSNVVLLAMAISNLV